MASRKKPSRNWRGWLKPENRCLVPANSFAEHAPEPNPLTKKKDVVWFALNDDRPLFAFGGIYAAGTFGWGTIEIGLFGIFLTVTGTVGAYLGGRLDDRFGSKRVIVASLAALTAAVMAILLIDADHLPLIGPVAPPNPGGALFGTAAERAFLAIGIVIGLAAGPVQAAARTLLIRLAPADRVTQFFGLFALSGKVTAFIGPFLVGVVTAATASQKAGMAVMLVFFVAGLVVLRRIPS